MSVSFRRLFATVSALSARDTLSPFTFRWYSVHSTEHVHHAGSLWCSVLQFERKFGSSMEQKNHLWRPQPRSFGKDVFFWFYLFFREKDGFLVRNHLFLEKKMVLSNHPSKTHLFSRKRWFYQEKTSKNHLFREKKMVSNQKNHLFLEQTQKHLLAAPAP